MTGPEARLVGLGQALAEFEELLARWNAGEEPVDIDNLTHLPTYTKE